MKRSKYREPEIILPDGATTRSNVVDLNRARKKKDYALLTAKEREPFLSERTSEGYEWGWQFAIGTNPEYWAVRCAQVVKNPVNKAEPIVACVIPATAPWVVRYFNVDAWYDKSYAQMMEDTHKREKQKKSPAWYNVRLRETFDFGQEARLTEELTKWLNRTKEEGLHPTLVDVKGMLSIRTAGIIVTS